MKKTKCILILILLFIIIYFLQANFFTWFNIAGVMPNLFVTLVLFIGLFIGLKMGAVFGLFFGLILDIAVGREIGPSGIFFAVIGLIGESFDKNFSKENKLMIILLNIVCTIIYETLMYIYSFAKFKINIEIPYFVFNLFIECLFNTILIFIFYSGMKKLGYYLEENFKEKTILTRYF